MNWSVCFQRFAFLALLILLPFITLSGLRAQNYLNSTTSADCIVNFSEIMYHPLGTEAALEWIEIFNQTALEQDLSDWQLKEGVEFRFPRGTFIRPGEYLVIASDPQAFAAGTGVQALGAFIGRLGNEKEHIILENLNGRLMDEIEYDHDYPWPEGADGSGASLAKRFPGAPSGPPENWRASREIGGTPGAVNFPQTITNEEPVMDTLVANRAPGKWLVPSAGQSAEQWHLPAYSDFAWAAGSNGFGFEKSGATPFTPAARYYRFEGTGADLSGNGVHAFLQNGTRFVPEPAPAAESLNAVRFDGVNDIVKVEEPFAPVSYTISAWVKVTEIRRSSLIVFTSNNGPTTSWSHQLRLTETGRFEHYSFDGGGKQVTGTTVARAGEWYHVAAVAQENGQMRLYVNGVEEGSPVQIGTPWQLGNTWLFGSNSGHNFDYLNGVLDEVAFWHEALPPSQILSLAAGASPIGGGLNFFTTNVGDRMHAINSTLWARLPFSIPAGRFFDQLMLNVRYDDGFIIWLNGTEVARRNFTGTPAWNSNADGARADDQVLTMEAIDLNAFTSVLKSGLNILAIQGLNSAANDPDFGVQVELIGRRGTQATSDALLRFSEAPPVSTSPFWVELANTGAIPVQLANFSVRSSGGFSVPLPELLLGPGELFLLQSWPEGAFFALNDRLFIMSLDGSLLHDTVRLTDGPQARPSGDGSEAFLIPSATTPGAPNSFSLHDEIVINEIMYHGPPTYAQPGTPATTRLTPLIKWDSTWRYNQDGVDLGSAWREPRFDDSQWDEGRGVLGVRTGSLPEPIRTPLQLGKWTYYFRIPFQVTGPPGSCEIQLRTIIDDGAVFYLNGKEIYRERMPEGEIVYTTPGINLADPTIVGPITLDPDDFVMGTNWLAVEVHQWNATGSSDIVCAAELALCEIVDPGIPPTPFTRSEEQWIELYNRSTTSVDLSGWSFDDAVEFTFPANSILAPDSYIVVARDAAALRLKFPTARIIGHFQGRLRGKSERILLLDEKGNRADEVRYYDEDPWPAAADGGGSSLELIDPFADRKNPASWAASDESTRSHWKRYSYTATAVQPVYSPNLNNFHELRLGLLNDGEMLLDNVNVVENPFTAPRQLIQNPGFDDGANRWRLLGNHSHSKVIDDPANPGNKVLHLIATDARGYMHNQLETTLKVNSTITPVRIGTQYQVTFDAKWLSGSPQFHTELYYNRVARKTILELPPVAGTPGSRNSTYRTNVGPTYVQLSHSPVAPKPGQPIRVRVRPNDPDGIASMTLRYRAGSGPWLTTTMSAQTDGSYTGNIPAQGTDRTVVQFYVEGRDLRGATSYAPAKGPDSRALVRVDNRVPGPKRKGFHLILTPGDATILHQVSNMMSDDRLGATVVWDGREVFYDCGVHLHGSMFSRNDPNTCAFNIRFPADQLFRGVHRTVQIKRRAMGEIIAKHVQNQSGLPGMYEDVIEFYSHNSGNAGPARISLAHYNDIFLGSQWPDGEDGNLFNMEGIRVAEATDNNTPEGTKLPFPIGWVSNYDIADLGDDPEQYRFTTTLRNNRARDDYSAYIAMAKAFSMSGAALQKRAPEVMDVDEWMRMFALLSLFGIGDTYTQGNPHNLNFYVRPADNKVLAFPYDWDFFFALDANAPLWGGSNLAKIIGLPVYTRVFHGHLLDLMETTFNTSYLTKWVSVFGTATEESYNYVLDRVRARSTVVRSRLPAKINFEITTNSGNEIALTTPTATLEGRGWIDVRDIHFNDEPAPLSVTWLDASRWRISVPLLALSNSIALKAYNRRGEVVGEDSITITTSSPDDSQRAFLRITEIMYHPPAPTTEEQLAGFIDQDEFEFIELANIGPVSVSLDGVRFTAGIAFDFSTASVEDLAPGARLVLVKNANAFRARYGSGITPAGVYTGSLDNAGELLRLVDRNNLVIHEFAYDDRGSWPLAADGTGPSLVVADPEAVYNDPSNWRVGQHGGSPGGTESVRPIFQGISVVEGEVTLRFEAEPNQVYQLWATEQLQNPEWQLLREIPASDGGIVDLSEALNGNVSERYYLLVQP